jgi:hypothetical protein
MLLERTFDIANCVRLPEVEMIWERTFGKVKMLRVSGGLNDFGEKDCAPAPERLEDARLRFWSFCLDLSQKQRQELNFTTPFLKLLRRPFTKTTPRAQLYDFVFGAFA